MIIKSFTSFYFLRKTKAFSLITFFSPFCTHLAPLFISRPRDADCSGSLLGLLRLTWCPRATRERARARSVRTCDAAYIGCRMSTLFPAASSLSALLVALTGCWDAVLASLHAPRVPRRSSSRVPAAAAACHTKTLSVIRYTNKGRLIVPLSAYVAVPRRISS